LKKVKSNIEKSNILPIVMEFNQIFQKIDTQIHELHQCSSEDFLGLNADFKNYYKQSKLISDNANEIIHYLKETVTGDMLSDLNNLYRDLQLIQLNFSKHLAKSIVLLNKIFTLLETLFLPVKNLNQDLMTLKFLLASLNINNTTLKEVFGSNFEQLIEEYNHVINEFKINCYQNELNLSNLKDQVKKTLKTFESISEKNIQDLDLIINHIHYGIILFAEKHEEISRQIPELTGKTKNTYKSIANIITNLQYHDIIRQKMEHVQKTQKNVLNELQYATDGNGLEEFLVKTRDIANLQSAQLIHANKEYQHAIEIITEKFIAIGEDMATIASMCKDISASQKDSNESDLQGLLDKFKDSANVLNHYVKAGDSFTNHIDTLSVSINKASNTIAGFADVIKSLKNITSDTIKYFSSAKTEDKHIEKSLSQLCTLSEDVIKFENTIQNVFKTIKGIDQEILFDIQDHVKNTKKTISFKLAADNLNSIIYALSNKNALIKNLLENNFSISAEISKEVRESIGRIRYYEFFEKVIVDIIGEFNLVSSRIKSELKLQPENRADDLDSLKGVYTMASEHTIHDSYMAQVEDSSNPLHKKDSDTDEDDSNIELF